MKGKQGAGVGYAMVFIAALMWGTIGIFVKGISGAGVSSQTMAAFRLLMGAVLLVPVLMVMGCRGAAGDGVEPGPLALFKCDARSLGCCALVGIPGLVISNTCYYESMDAVGMSTASVLLYTSPVFGCILGRLLFREDMTPNKFVAIACNIAGCVLTVTDGDLTGFHFSVYGIAIGVVAGFLGAMLAVFSRMATARMHPLAVTFWGFVFGGGFMAALTAPWTDLATALSPQLIGLFAGFGLIPTALAYVFYMQGLSLGLETSKVPVIASFETVATVLVGICIYAESAGAVKMLGILLVLGSIVIMNTDFSRLRHTALAAHVAESMGFKPNVWWSGKSRDMDLFRERTGVALEPTVQQSPWFFVR